MLSANKHIIDGKLAFVSGIIVSATFVIVVFFGRSNCARKRT